MPLFPLGIVLYPNDLVPLHIFEPRYKRMIGDCRNAEEDFGIVLLTGSNMAKVGCRAAIADVTREYSDGRLDIQVRGTVRFTVGEVTKTGPYLSCEYEPIEEPDCTAAATEAQRAITQHMKLLELANRRVRPSIYEDVECLSYLIARNAGLDLRQKQEVLEIPRESQRISYLVSHMEQFIPRVEQMESLRSRIQSNGHFEEFPPRQESDE